MGWFENQIEERQNADQQLLDDSFGKVSEAVLGKWRAYRAADGKIVTKNAIDEILKYYRCKPVSFPQEISSVEAQLDYCLRPSGIMHRTIELKKGWYKDAYGPVLAYMKEDGLPSALIPAKIHGYLFRDPLSGQMRKVNAKTAELFMSEAECFYRPLPQKKLGIYDLLAYIKNCISLSDAALIALASLAVTLVGLLLPRFVHALSGPVLSSGKLDALIGAAISIFCVALSSQLIGCVRGLAQSRLETKTSVSVQAAMMMRLLSLPADFFRQYSPGEMKSRAGAVDNLCTMLIEALFAASLSSLFSLLYIVQIFRFTPALALPSFVIVAITVVFSVISTLIETRITRRRMELAARESGMSYSLITSVQKIRLSGAEKRVFAKWMDCYADEAQLTYSPPLFIKIYPVISSAIALFSTVALYYAAVRSGVSQSAYFAFTTAFGMLMGAFNSVSGIAFSAAQIRPILEVAEPFLKTEPETSEQKEIVTRISGEIEMSHVSFRYSENAPYVLDDLSLKVKAGEYVAIVGKTGCGKSTLVRLLLGFENPEKGAVYYDGKDIKSLDLASLRRKIGTVMQDAGLFRGDIYSNIVITAPQLSVKQAWEAAETAGIAEDIRALPMGMHTMISEGSGGISGGQRQRLMIARAVAPKPKLLIFDEATSALDNKSQRQVSEALDSMGCTRLVIAHRLSTIKHCDRILVLDKGRIAEDGTYEQLIEQNGLFAQLVKRQRLDIDES